jgi:hypothetical protein
MVINKNKGFYGIFDSLSGMFSRQRESFKMLLRHEVPGLQFGHSERYEARLFSADNDAQGLP